MSPNDVKEEPRNIHNTNNFNVLTKEEKDKDKKGEEKTLIEKFKMFAMVIAIIIFSSAVIGNPLDLFFSSNSTLEDKQKTQVVQLFDSIDGVNLQSINIGYSDVAVSNSSLLTASKNVTVASGVVVVYSGNLKAPYEVTKAISLLLDVPIHQIQIINTTDLGGN